jgi:hypothetical protein
MGIAFVVAMIYMVVLRYFAGLVTWLTIIAYFICLIVLGILLISKGKEWVDEVKIFQITFTILVIDSCIDEII